MVGGKDFVPVPAQRRMGDSLGVHFPVRLITEEGDSSEIRIQEDPALLGRRQFLVLMQYEGYILHLHIAVGAIWSPTR